MIVHEICYKNPNRLKPIKEYQLTPALAYVFGVMDGDGCAYVTNSWFLRLNAMDEDFCREFARQLKIAEPDCSPCVYKLKDERRGWIGAVGNKSLYHAYLNFNRELLNATDSNIKSMYLRGFGDSEGCVCKTNHVIFISNTDVELLVIIQKLLAQLGIYSKIERGSPRYKSHWAQCYNIKITGKWNLVRYRDLIGYSIKRKQRLLDLRCNSYIVKCYTPDVYYAAMDLFSQSLSLNEIQRMINVPRQTLHDWVINGAKPHMVKNKEANTLCS